MVPGAFWSCVICGNVSPSLLGMSCRHGLNWVDRCHFWINAQVWIGSLRNCGVDRNSLLQPSRALIETFWSMISKDSTFKWPETYSPLDSDNPKCFTDVQKTFSLLVSRRIFSLKEVGKRFCPVGVRWLGLILHLFFIVHLPIRNWGIFWKGSKSVISLKCIGMDQLGTGRRQLLLFQSITKPVSVLSVILKDQKILTN